VVSPVDLVENMIHQAGTTHSQAFKNARFAITSKNRRGNERECMKEAPGWTTGYYQRL